MVAVSEVFVAASAAGEVADWPSVAGVGAGVGGGAVGGGGVAAVGAVVAAAGGGAAVGFIVL
jgi:hypothetical protein